MRSPSSANSTGAIAASPTRVTGRNTLTCTRRTSRTTAESVVATRATRTRARCGKHMKVHSKSPPPPGSFDEAHDNSSSEPSPAGSTETNSQNVGAGGGGSGGNTGGGSSITASSLATNAGTNLSEWYVCQSAGGMPTPPSNEPSPVGSGANNHGPTVGSTLLTHSAGLTRNPNTGSSYP